MQKQHHMLTALKSREITIIVKAKCKVIKRILVLAETEKTGTWMTNLSRRASDRNFSKVRGPPSLYSWNKCCPDSVFGRLLNEVLHFPLHYRMSLRTITNMAGMKIRIYFTTGEQKHGCEFTVPIGNPAQTGTGDGTFAKNLF